MTAWVSNQQEPPAIYKIAGERAARIAFINRELDPEPLGVHPHFIENPSQRELLYGELNNDMKNLARQVFFSYCLSSA